jgi:hypothetical protein
LSIIVSFYRIVMASKAGKGGKTTPQAPRVSAYAQSVDEQNLDLSLNALKSISVPDIGLLKEFCSCLLHDSAFAPTLIELVDS